MLGMPLVISYLGLDHYAVGYALGDKVTIERINAADMPVGCKLLKQMMLSLC